MKTNTFLFIILFATFSCKNDKKLIELEGKAQHIIKIPLLSAIKKEKQEKLSAIIDSSFVVKLETNKNCLINNIDKMIVYEDKIYILDKKKSNGVFEFTKEGKFIKKFGKKGKGPGEYIDLKAFTINKKERRVILFDWSRKRFLAYNLQGDYIGSRKIEFYLNDFTMNEGNYVLDIHNRIRSANDREKKFSIASLDNKAVTINTFFNSTIKIDGYASFKNLSKDKERVFFKEPYSNKIHEIKDGKSLLLFELDFEDITLPKSLLQEELDYGSLRNELSTKKYTFMNSTFGYQIIDDVLSFSIQHGKNINKYIYSVNKEKLYPVDFLVNDSDGFGLIGNTIGSYDRYLVNYVHPEWIIPMREFTKSNKIKQFLAELEVTDNPILIFNRLKEKL